MKTPIWLYEPKSKSYIPFPIHLLETFEDGTQGFNLETGRITEKIDFYLTHRRYFNPQYGPLMPNHDRYVLRDRPRSRFRQCLIDNRPMTGQDLLLMLLFAGAFLVEGAALIILGVQIYHWCAR